MPRPIWTGAVSFGLVNVPVKLVTAARDKDVRFHQLEAGTNARVRNRRVSSVTGEEVPYERIVKGYEVAPDRYVVVEPSELEALDPKATRLVEIEEFVDLHAIDPVFFDRPYYLVPAAGGAKPYRLLVEAMADTGKAAVGRFVLRNKEHLVAIRPLDGALVLEVLRFADEVVPVETLEELDELADVEVRERELTMARELVASLSSSFEPEKYHDTYRERVLELIEAKAAGEEVVGEAPTEQPTEVVDLMAALEASLAAAKHGRSDGGAPVDPGDAADPAPVGPDGAPPPDGPGGPGHPAEADRAADATRRTA